MLKSRKMLCSGCRSKLINNEIALSIKLIGLNQLKLFCYNCLADEMNMKTGTLREIADYYHSNGCSIFQKNYVLEGEDPL